MRLYVDPEVRERLERLEIPFGEYGFDNFGISREHLGFLFSVLKPFYNSYFRVQVRGIEHVPRGRTMLIGNHSGGLPVDGAMVLAALFFAHDPPRLLHGMVEKFAARWPFLAEWFDRLGQFTGIPDNALRLLEADRALLVFPEGVRGIGKLYWERYQMVRFGTGFMRLALAAKAPIVPFAFVGGEEALPTVYHARTLARLVRAPYWPVPPYLIPFPLPYPCRIEFGAPLLFSGSGDESDAQIETYVERVRVEIAALIARGRAAQERPR